MVGRFTSVDPAKDGLNWYAYCGNDPVNFVDINGTNAVSLLVKELTRKSLKETNFFLQFITDSIWNKYSEELIMIYNAGADEHYKRNELNVNKDSVDWSEYDSFIEYVESEYKKQNNIKNKFHQNTDGNQGADAENNIKYLSTDGHYEVIICYPENGTPYVVDESVDPRNMGTYNYYPNYIKHLVYDVFPYFLYGNSENDSYGYFNLESGSGGLSNRDFESIRRYSIAKLYGLVH